MMELRKATLDDGAKVLQHLRQEQRETLEKLDLDPGALLAKALDKDSITVLFDGEIAAVFGAMKATLLGDAKIWMITTDLIKQNPISFLRASRRITEELYIKHGPLIGMVDADFEKSRRWLRWIGFNEAKVGSFIIMRYEGGY
jgi:hypothetical protein